MKANFCFAPSPLARREIPLVRQRTYWMAISLASLACGSTALAQITNSPANPPGSNASTNAPATPPSETSTNVTHLGDVKVVEHLNEARQTILSNIGATKYNLDKEQIQSVSLGENAEFRDLIERMPGVARDSAVNGDLHVRGEHANLQYRINDVLLPEGITGFGLELDPRFVDSMSLITGSLPAEYGFRTAGVVDIQTKSGVFENGGTAEIYGGSHDTIRPSFEYGGSEGRLNYFVDGSYDHNSLGVENVTSTHDAIHDKTDQGRMFAYLSYLLDDTSRVSFMLSGSYSTFQIPDAPGNTTPAFPVAPGQPATFDSANLNENQKEQNYYSVVTYQKSAGDLNFQLSAYGRNSDVHFMPDPVGDLYFNGVSSDVDRDLFSGGVQADASWEINDQHTLRFGGSFLDETVEANSTTGVYDLTGGVPVDFRYVVDNNNLHGYFLGTYAQDEWKLFPRLTLNYGARFDLYSSSFVHQNQPSPRVNLVYRVTDSTTLHAGYARYFTPPPIENVPPRLVTEYNGTSNASAVTTDDSVKAERANYFDAGISQKIAEGFQVGVDTFYKRAQNQLDDGLFGQTLILSAFNYARGEVYGGELTGSYTSGGFSAYSNFGWTEAKGEDWSSAQFLFSQNDINYVQNHWIKLDHDQRFSGSFGVSYLWHCSHGSTRVFADALYGSGLRTTSPSGGLEPSGDPIPNGSTVPASYTINVGAEHIINLGKNMHLKARLDIVNLTDNAYEFRNGFGVGVNLPQWGARRGYFGTIGFSF
jgi:outer membrane receptor protein involved in Fe transport